MDRTHKRNSLLNPVLSRSRVGRDFALTVTLVQTRMQSWSAFSS
jgi:hypothetical protein